MTYSIVWFLGPQVGRQKDKHTSVPQTVIKHPMRNSLPWTDSKCLQLAAWDMKSRPLGIHVCKHWHIQHIAACLTGRSDGNLPKDATPRIKLWNLGTYTCIVLINVWASVLKFYFGIVVKVKTLSIITGYSTFMNMVLFSPYIVSYK